MDATSPRLLTSKVSSFACLAMLWAILGNVAGISADSLAWHDGTVTKVQELACPGSANPQAPLLRQSILTIETDEYVYRFFGAALLAAPKEIRFAIASHGKVIAEDGHGRPLDLRLIQKTQRGPTPSVAPLPRDAKKRNWQVGTVEDARGAFFPLPDASVIFAPPQKAPLPLPACFWSLVHTVYTLKTGSSTQGIYWSKAEPDIAVGESYHVAFGKRHKLYILDSRGKEYQLSRAGPGDGPFHLW